MNSYYIQWLNECVKIISFTCESELLGLRWDSGVYTCQHLLPIEIYQSTTEDKLNSVEWELAVWAACSCEQLTNDQLTGNR